MPGRQVMTAKASTKFQRKMRVRSKSPVNQVQNQNSHIHTRNVVPRLQKMDKRKIKFERIFPSKCPCMTRQGREGTLIGGVPFGRQTGVPATSGCKQLAGWSLLVAGVRSVNLLQVLPGPNCPRQVHRSCD